MLPFALLIKEDLSFLRPNEPLSPAIFLYRQPHMHILWNSGRRAPALDCFIDGSIFRVRTRDFSPRRCGMADRADLLVGIYSDENELCDITRHWYDKSKSY